MSRKKQKPNRAERQRRQEERAKTEFVDVIQDTAGTFTCSHELAHDYAWQCGHSIEELEGELLFNRIAGEIWRDHTGNARELAQTVADFLAERERHRAALSDLEKRFLVLADTDSHEHLEPIETYRELVRDRLSTALAFQKAEPEESEAQQSNSNEF
jgi:hypothetical protein